MTLSSTSIPNIGGCQIVMTTDSGQVYACVMADCNGRNHYFVRQIGASAKTQSDYTIHPGPVGRA